MDQDCSDEWATFDLEVEHTFDLNTRHRTVAEKDDGAARANAVAKHVEDVLAIVILDRIDRRAPGRQGLSVTSTAAAIDGASDVVKMNPGAVDRMASMATAGPVT